MKNETFEQLMVGGAEVALSDDQRQFVATHRRILACGNMAGQYLVEMAQNLKAMRDGKLYRAAGFAEFRDYVREAIGIEERQAYNYIRVAEGLPKDCSSIWSWAIWTPNGTGDLPGIMWNVCG